jgi:hypothetical protein
MKFPDYFRDGRYASAIREIQNFQFQNIKTASFGKSAFSISNLKLQI